MKIGFSCPPITYLARIKNTLYGDIAHVGVCDGRHPRFLHRWNATLGLGVQDEYGHNLFPPQAIDSRAVLSRRIVENIYIHNLGAKCAHLPVSPLVAPTTVKDSGRSPADLCAFLLARKNSNRLPRSCNATSLNEKVGAWKSSRMNSLSLSFVKGVMSACRNVVVYDRLTSARNSSWESSSGEM
jgi:hypothetical protein